MEFEYPDDLKKVLAFHGHMCPGIAIGYRLAKAALAALGYTHPDEGELVVVAETDRCTIDAFQVILGCTVGKGNLQVNPTGKQAFSVACRQSGKAVRVVYLPYNYTKENDDLTRRVMSGRVSDEEYMLYKSEREKRIREVLTMPENELLKISETKIDLPEKEMIFNSPCCSYCGEQLMEPWARLRDGKIACVSCAAAN